MSVKDLPDYTRQVVIRYEGGFIGLEELAARLGSIVPYDLRGNIVLMEDFESEETEWTFACDSLGSTITRSTQRKYSGDWAVKLYSCASTASYGRLNRSLHYPGLAKYGLFGRLNWDKNCQEVSLYYQLNTGSKMYSVYVGYNLPSKKLYIMTWPYAEYIVDSNLSLGVTAPIWYPLLLTFDLTTGCYDKLYIAEKEYDISGVPFRVGNDPLRARSWLNIECFNVNGVAFTTYVDDIIIAKNVP